MPEPYQRFKRKSCQLHIRRPFPIRILLFFFCLLISVSFQVEPNIVSKAAEYAEKEMPNTKVSDSRTDTKSLFHVAKVWYMDEEKRKDALELFHLLADSADHVLSMSKLGEHYAFAGNRGQALHYFGQAGELGPHHPSLYNAGRMYAEDGDWVSALAFLKAAMNLAETHPKHAQASIAKVARDAFGIIGHQIALLTDQLAVEQAADVFFYASTTDELPESAEELWKQGVTAIHQFNETFVTSSGKVQDTKSMVTATEHLRDLWESHSAILSPLQIHLLLVYINDMLGPLTGMDDRYVPMAAGYAEALASASKYCYDSAAVSEHEAGCFNTAASNAMAYYRRASDPEGSKRVIELARKHPTAATNWIRVDQTPQVFHEKLTAKPWWNAKDFSAAHVLAKAYKTYKPMILQELKDIQKLPEGQLRQGAGSSSTARELEMDATGSIRQQDDDGTANGLQRIFTPFIGVRTEREKTSRDGAGGWAEFGPLFDGIAWNEKNCRVVPTICQLLKDDFSLCTSLAKRMGMTITNSTVVRELCGADTVVTIYRIRPGTIILPHCGTTNSRLQLYFALQGADGVEITVGGETKTKYEKGDGNAIVFDDSYETSVYNGGKQDHFMVVAILAHPDLF